MKSNNPEKSPLLKMHEDEPPCGILLVNKPKGRSSFSLIPPLRRLTGVKKIGHAGTLDPFATGVLVLLIGKNFTKNADLLLNQDKEYEAMLHLGIATDTFDLEGIVQQRSDKIPTHDEILVALAHFQGTVLQTPPMFSAKKQGGKKLYELARKGIVVERPAVAVQLTTTLLSYNYPFLKLHIRCSKGTYIRTLGDDLGKALGSFAHLCELTRTRSGSFHIADCIEETEFKNPKFAIKNHLRQLPL